MPAILGLVGALVPLAEKLFFEKSGDKHGFVLELCELAWDKGLVHISHDFPKFDEKKFFMGACKAALDALES